MWFRICGKKQAAPLLHTYADHCCQPAEISAKKYENRPNQKSSFPAGSFGPNRPERKLFFFSIILYFRYFIHYFI
jgi:hypothetical protein